LTELIASALALGNEIVKLINAKEATKYIDKMNNLKMKIYEEEKKGDFCNDARVEYLQGELRIILDTITQMVVQQLAGSK